MAEPNANKTFWSFVWYLMNSPNKAGLNRQDIHLMAEKFADANSGAITDATDPGGTYTDAEWPDKDGGSSSITAIGNSSTDITGNVRWDLVDPASQVTLDQAYWPETHLGS